MRGVHFLIDELGRKSAAVVDLRVHGDLWQDIKALLEKRKMQVEKPTGSYISPAE